METRGKSINLFLMDGTATGRVKCTLANWTGVAYKMSSPAHSSQLTGGKPAMQRR